MAKIRFSKLSGKAPKGRKIKSIVGENYLNNYEARFQKHDEIAHRNHRARIKAKEVVLLENSKQEDDL